MPKMKSNSGAKKRFKISGTGKVLFAAAGKRHLNTKKARKRKRHLKANAVVSDVQEHQIKAILPYGAK